MFPISPKWDNEPTQLSDEQTQDPYQVLRDFFDDMKLAEIRQDLANQLEVSFTTENTFFAAPWQRADLLHRYNRLIELLEAASLIVQEGRSDCFQTSADPLTE